MVRGMGLVLINGLSGTGKSTLVRELRARGHRAYDADGGFAQPREDGEWGWNMATVTELFRDEASDTLVFLRRLLR